MQLKKIMLFIVLLTTIKLHAQKSDSTYAEKLGYPKGAKVLIIHVDDAGMSYDSNEGAIEAITKGAANSTSVMMPCAWVPAFVHFLKKHPEVDAGLHLTLTSEWSEYRWRPISGKNETPGLADSEGDLWPDVPDVVKHASGDEVEKEIRAQLARARSMGFEPTHLDSHMGTLFATPDFLQRYVKVGIENHIPIMLPGGNDFLIQQQMNAPDELINQLRTVGKLLWAAGLPVLDDLHNFSYDWKAPANMKAGDRKVEDYKTQKYIDALKQLKPGITMMIMHCTAPSETFQYITDSGPLRQADLLAMLNPAFKKALKDEGIILTTWRELKQRRMQVAN
ncbi:MAG: polysaccharide deacetylase family protein [Bacteroidota bacterium]|nr:polysaccharide deacetylase family protein [Bacteroidota bacterium]